MAEPSYRCYVRFRVRARPDSTLLKEAAWPIGWRVARLKGRGRVLWFACERPPTLRAISLVEAKLTLILRRQGDS